jgi:hypothetical protein
MEEFNFLTIELNFLIIGLENFLIARLEIS